VTALPLLPFGLAVFLFGHSDGPPPATTGGFGEQTCHACHFDNPPHPPSEVLSLEAPPRFEPGENYLITVRITRKGIKSGGFQLSSRFTGTGDQAGSLQPLDGRTSLTSDETGSIFYIQHTREGQKLTGESEAKWQFSWQAPGRRAPVVMHVAANAANHDASELGDLIFTTELTIQPAK